MMRAIFLKTSAVLFFFCWSASLPAQVCNGSLGDPVVNVTFSSGDNPGLPLASASTSYNFVTTSCPDDGNYTVVNSTSGCFGNSWHSISEDHTPNDVNGYMMLVNATFTPGDFYVDTVKGLCANTTYEFAAWITNVLGATSCTPTPILPKLVFNIETVNGVVLGTYSTGDIPGTPSAVWKQYGLFFTTPANTNNVVIRLTNTAPGGCGNDIALDDITFRPCGPTVNLGATNDDSGINLCRGDLTPVSIDATLGPGYNTPNFQWQESTTQGNSWIDLAGATTSSFTFFRTASGVYQYRLAVADGTNILLTKCRIASEALSITIHDKPVIDATVNSPVCEGSFINLGATGAFTYAWKGVGGFTATGANPVLAATGNAAGQYLVTGTDQFGCIDSASTNVIVNPKPTATVSSDVIICRGDSTILRAAGGITYEWSPTTGLSSAATNNSKAKPDVTTLYQVVVTGSNACTDTARVTVTVLPKPVANAGGDKMLLKGESAILDGVISNTNVTFYWTPASTLNDASATNPVATPLTNQVYTLHVESDNGCGSSTDDVFVKVYNDIYIPKAFSPNNDGLNDSWNIEALGVFPNAIMRVYNRFGQLVFEGSALNT
ncbi:MAG: gliding motility-associated C-terminal domain-containing protein, partial [Ferruginibacter sp.]|nr:gliding motility-associated C-terminal domain-containing protein [Ferruginibacter sp.]